MQGIKSAEQQLILDLFNKQIQSNSVKALAQGEKS